MRKRKKGRQLGLSSDQRKALLKLLASALILKEKIKTTEAKAKELATYVEKKISRAKKGDIPARRILAKFFTPSISKRLIEEIAPRYKDRKGGYTRIFKLGPRKSDGARMAIIELVK
ncbi:MAG: 50S ribosomal protein L17 [Candidatus Pacebacteria bacterium]|nr:50S ribosomal protein L17 [Candidatus Paceibacterota bacterium]